MKKKNNFFSYIWMKMRHNWGLKVLSILFAIVLWRSAVVEADPLRPVTFEDIPITVTGLEQLSEKDLALVKSISSLATTAKVTLNINWSQLSDFDESTIWVNLDVSRISGTGTHEIKLNCTLPNTERIFPETIKVEVDELANRVIPVECEVVGTLTEGYHKGALSVSPNTIQVSGAKSIVEKIENAYMRLDLTDRTQSVNISKEYTFIDKNGSAIDPSALNVSVDSVALDMQITPTKNLLITPTILGRDNVQEGYQITNIIVEPDTIKVTGDAELLEGLTALQLDGIQIAAGQAEDVFMQELKIQAPPGITLLGLDTASVLVQIEEQMSEAVFEGVDIELRNVPEGLQPVDFQTKVDITVIAPTTVIDNIVANHITLYVDMTGAEAGEATLPILYEAPEEYRIKNVVISQSTVTVVLK